MLISPAVNALVCAALTSIGCMAQQISSGSADRRYPISVADRRIDETGREEQIESEEKAGIFVDALVAKLSPATAALSGMDTFKSRGTKAEYAAVRDPEQIIPEASLAAAFNRPMHHLDAPGWTRVSDDEMHGFRVTQALLFYPNSVTRLQDGNLARTCRPTEGLYLVYKLYVNGGVSPNVRNAISEKGLPPLDPSAVDPPLDFRLRAVRVSPAEVQRRREYAEARARYFTSHPDVKPETLVRGMFDLLGIK